MKNLLQIFFLTFVILQNSSANAPGCNHDTDSTPAVNQNMDLKQYDMGKILKCGKIMSYPYNHSFLYRLKSLRKNWKESYNKKLEECKSYTSTVQSHVSEICEKSKNEKGYDHKVLRALSLYRSLSFGYDSKEAFSHYSKLKESIKSNNHKKNELIISGKKNPDLNLICKDIEKSNLCEYLYKIDDNEKSLTIREFMKSIVNKIATITDSQNNISIPSENYEHILRKIPYYVDNKMNKTELCIILQTFIEKKIN